MTSRIASAPLALSLALATKAVRAEDNVLTEAERRDGWELLFDGRTTGKWMTLRGEPVPPSHVQEAALNPHRCDYMLVYQNPLGDFILDLDFKISRGCNTGVFVRTFPLTPRPGKSVGFNGIEVAIDDTPGAGFHDTGAIYDLVAPKANAMRRRGCLFELDCFDAYGPDGITGTQWQACHRVPGRPAAFPAKVGRVHARDRRISRVGAVARGPRAGRLRGPRPAGTRGRRARGPGLVRLRGGRLRRPRAGRG